MLLHRLWVSGEVYDPLYNAHRRQAEGGGLKRGHELRASKEEVKIPLQRLATLKWRMATADLARTRFGSSIRRLRHANLVHLSRKTARKIAAPLARKDGSHNAQSHRRVNSLTVRIEA